jgi:hypothetical protein
MGGIYRWSEWAPPLIWGGNSMNPGRPTIHVACRPPNSTSTDFRHRIPCAPTLLDTLVKQKLKWSQHLARRPRRWGRPAPLWLGWAHALCHVTPLCHYLWLCLILDILKICMDFGPYDTFPSSDVPETVDQQNFWNTLVISTYLLYLAWNVGMLAVNICILWPSTPPTLRALLIPE